MPSPIDVEKRARSLRAEALQHKRAAGRHRRRMRECYEALEVLRAECARMGITLEIHAVAEVTTHGQTDERGGNRRTG